MAVLQKSFSTTRDPASHSLWFLFAHKKYAKNFLKKASLLLVVSCKLLVFS